MVKIPPQPPRIHILMILLTVAWMCGSHQRQQLEDTAGAATITLSSSRNNRSRPILSRERGFMVLTMQAKQNTYNGESHISLPNFGKASEENRDQQQGPRTSVRKSNLKVPTAQLTVNASPSFHRRCLAAGFGWLA